MDFNRKPKVLSVFFPFRPHRSLAEDFEHLGTGGLHDDSQRAESCLGEAPLGLFGGEGELFGLVS